MPKKAPIDDEISMWEILAVLVRGRAVIVGSTIIGGVLAATAMLLSADSFTTSVAFRPQDSDTPPSQLLALAGQFGVNIGGGTASGASPALYAELLTSREILSRISEKVYEIDGVGRTVLADLLEIEEDTEDLRREEVIEWLRERTVSVSTAGQTGTITLSVETEWPNLSYSMATALLDEIIRFNMDTRRSQAAAEREFIEARVDSARLELEAMESGLQTFLEANRQWENSPMLIFQHDRLQRDVVLRQSVLTTLVQSYEQARIAEVRDTPVITVLQQPYLPPGPDDRPLVIAIAAGIILGGLVGLVLAFVVEVVRHPVAGDHAREDFQESWEGFVRTIPIVGRRLA